MTDIERYLAEEVAIDFRDGFISRREAIRRLALLGLGTVSASALLTACGGDTGGSPNTSATTSTTAPASASAATSAAPSSSTSAAQPPKPPPDLPASAPTEMITFGGPEGRKLKGGFAAADKPKGAVLVIHENKGLNDHTRHVAGRFAKVGYSAFAIDLLSAEGGTETFGDPAEATAALGKAPAERHVADLRASLDELAKRTPKVKLAAIGFCFGGGMTWRLVTTKDPRLAAAPPFYGPLSDGADFTGAKTAVLGVYAEADARVNASRDAAKAALEKAKLTHEIVTYAGDHAFFNDARERYHDASAKAAWTKVLAWFGQHVG